MTKSAGKPLSKTDLLIADLLSANDDKVLAAIKELPDHGNEKAVAPLIDVLVETENEAVLRAAKEVLLQLKTQKAVEPLAAAIRDPKYAAQRSTLISVFWEAGLNASGEIELLVDTAIAGDYMVAFECLTVLENLDGPLEAELVAPQIKKLTEALHQSADKEPILRSMAQLLQDFIIGG